MYHILIADDEELERKVLNKILTDYYKEKVIIYTVSTGREAIEMAQIHKIDAVLMDIDMPVINGIDSSKEIKRIQPDCSILFVTAYDDFEYAQKAIKLGAKDYILKPYLASEIIHSIQESIELCELRIEREQYNYALMNQKKDINIISQSTARVVEEIKEYISNYYDRDISLQDVANVMNYSEAYFSRLFKQLFDKNFTTYLMEYRIQMATQLLQQDGVSIKEVGVKVGYVDNNYFTKVFRRITGMNPSDYRSSKKRN